MVYSQELFVEIASWSKDLRGASGAVTPWFLANLWHLKVMTLLLVCSRFFILGLGKGFEELHTQY